MASQSKRTKPFDAADYLDSEKAVVAYIEEALSTGDADTIRRAISIAERAHGKNQRPRRIDVRER
jgi:DNA-binding phage protein